jgi:oligogalacturonide lyase
LTLSFLPDERGFCCFTGGTLVSASFTGNKLREFYRIESGWERGTAFGIAEDGLYAVVSENMSGKSRLRLVGMTRPSAATLVETDQEITFAMPRPKRAGVLYKAGDELWVANYDGQQTRKIKTPPGGIGNCIWSADGKTVLYLSYPEDKTKLHQIRQATPDTGEDKLVASTSQFVNFARNADATVFAGMSANKASPHVLLLVRAVRRELTLCEHRASDPSKSPLVFSRNSQRLFFQTDRQGKPAIYSIVVDRFVEETES